MDGMFMIIISIVIIIITGIVFAYAYISVGSMIGANMWAAIRESTLMAVVSTGSGTYYVEVVWTGPVIPPRYFVLSNGQLITPPQPYQCGVGNAPAPYRYCLYKVQASAEPMGLIIGG